MDWLDWAAKIWAINRATVSLRTGCLIDHAGLDTSKLQDVAIAEAVGVVVLKDSNCDRLVIVKGGIRLLSAS